MAFEQTEQEARYPWLSWAITGVFTLAGMLIIGLVISARNPPQAALPTDTPPRSEQPALPAATDASATRPPSTSSAGGATHVEPRLAAAPQPVTIETSRSDGMRPKTANIAPLQTQPAVAAESAATPAESAATPPKALQPALPDAAKTAAYQNAVMDVRRFMASRNITASKERLKVAAAIVQTPAENAELKRLETIQGYLEEFWDGIRGAVAAMQPATEIVLSEVDRVAVIESSRTELAVQMYGRQKRYAIEALPMDLLAAIAKSSFKLTPGTKLVVGAFLATDANGNRAEARKLWNEAIASGETDGRLLLPELDVPPPTSR